MTSQRRYAFVMLILTCSYLICELGFNARLLDVVGGDAGPLEIDAIQKWGRVISGTALTLAIWGTILFPAASRHGWIRNALLPIAALIAAGCLATAWIAERALVDSIVNPSNGELRRTAVYLRLASIAALNGKLPISDINLGDPDVRGPAAKAFLAIFPGFALSYPDIRSSLDRLIRDPRMRTAVTDASALVPTPQALWTGILVPLFAKARVNYDGPYADGNSQYHKVLATIPQVQAEKWQEYTAQLQQYGFTPQSAEPIKALIVASLRARDLNIPSDWNPANRDVFDDAIAERVRKAALAAFADESKRRLGGALAPDLQWSDFCAQTAIQDNLRSAIRLTGNIPLSCAMDFSEFAATVYPPLAKMYAATFVERIQGRSTDDFADGGPSASVGKLALATVVVPPIALAFSLLGALVHIFKVLKYALMAASLPSLVAAVLSGSLVAIAVALPFRSPNPITESHGYGKLEANKITEMPFGQLESGLYRWAIQAQPYFYPLNETVRKELLKDYKFDSFPEIDAFIAKGVIK
jgi:hypothetical protein